MKKNILFLSLILLLSIASGSCKRISNKNETKEVETGSYRIAGPGEGPGGGAVANTMTVTSKKFFENNLLNLFRGVHVTAKSKIKRQSLQDAIKFPDGSTQTVAASTTPKAPVTPAAPLPPQTQTIPAGSKTNVATKSDVDQATANLQNKKNQIQNLGPVSVPGGNYRFTPEEYNLLALGVLKQGDLLGKAAQPQNAGSSDIYMSRDNTIHRGINNATDPFIVSRGISQNNQVLNTSAQQQP